MTRLSRLLSLLFVCSLGPLVLAQSADLSVIMTAPSTTVYTTSYAEANAQFTVTNAGPFTAQGVVVDFDSSVRYVNCPTGFTSSQAGGHYRCTAASMAPGSLSGTFSTEWDQAPNGTVETLTATVASSSADPNTANNSASAKTTVIWQSDLHINPFVPSTAAPGASVDVMEFYYNYGPSPASDYKLTISVPPGALYDHFSADPSSALKCTEPPKGGSGDLVCTNPNLIPVSDFTVTATVRIDPAAASGTVLTFPVKATSSSAAAPFETSSSLTVLSPADLGVTVSAPASVVAGNSFLTTITLTNAGPAAALDVSVDYVQPNGPNTYGTISAPPDWVCTRSVCTNHSFAPGTATFTIPVPIESFTKSGTMTGEVIVESANDPNSANNTASAATTIIAAPQATVQALHDRRAGRRPHRRPAHVHRADQEHEQRRRAERQPALGAPRHPRRDDVRQREQSRLHLPDDRGGRDADGDVDGASRRRPRHAPDGANVHRRNEPPLRAAGNGVDDRRHSAARPTPRRAALTLFGQRRSLGVCTRGEYTCARAWSHCALGYVRGDQRE
jgi:hypothetical protein